MWRSGLEVVKKAKGTLNSRNNGGHTIEKTKIKDVSGLCRFLTGMVPDSSQSMLEKKYHDRRGNCFPIRNSVKTK